LSFKLDDLLILKEIRKISENKEEILKCLTGMNFLEQDKNQENQTKSFNLIVEDNIQVFTILNIPQKMKKEEIIEQFKISSGELLRIYKKSLFWHVVLISTEGAKEFRRKLENTTFVSDI